MNRLTANGTITSMSASIHSVAVNAWGRHLADDSESRFIPALEIGVFDIERVDVSWEVTEDCKQDVYPEISSATSDEEDADGWEEDGDDYEEEC